MTTKKVIMFSVIGFIVTALVLGGIFFFVTSKDSEEKTVDVKTSIYSLGENYANLQESRRILKIKVDVEIADETLVQTFTDENSKIKNRILEIIGSKTEEDVLAVGGQANLRKELLKEIKKIIPSNDIIDIFFVEFIVQ